MVRKSFAKLLKIGSVAFLLFLLLFACGGWQSSANFIGFALREIAAVLRDSETQWMVFLCLGIYFAVFSVLRLRVENTLMPRREGAEIGAHRLTHPTFWIAGVLLVAAIHYAANYSPSLPALILLFGATIGQGVGLLKNGKRIRLRNTTTRQEAASGNGFGLLVVSLLVILLGVASVWNDKVGHSYAYRSQTRWTGPWDNPNIFGLLMGTGVALAIGMGLRGWRVEGGKSKAKSGVWRLAFGKVNGARFWRLASWKFVFVGLCFLAAILMTRGLLHSYSRGAWLATGCGLAYLIGSWIWRLGSGGSQLSTINNLLSIKARWFQKNWLPLAVVLVAVGAICYWHFRQADWHPARRVLSAVNPVDFSWRNRVAAWVGDLQMIVEHPWLGAGWNQPELLYEHYYLPPRLTESAAIEMNDYLMLGATLGIPALFCFGMYLWLSLTRNAECGVRNHGENSESGKQKAEMNWLQITCRAGAIVLLVGFWFDGGLFKLATTATFWILLELGSVQPRMDTNKHQ